MKRLYIYLFIVLFSVSNLVGQESYTPFLLDSIARESGYYIPSSEIDNMIDFGKRREAQEWTSPIVEYLRRADLAAPRTVLSSTLSLPLSLQVRSLSHLSKKTQGFTLIPDSLHWSIEKAYHRVYKPQPYQLNIPKRISRLEQEMQFYSYVMNSLQSNHLSFFHYIPDNEDSRRRLTLANHSDLRQSFGSRQIQVETIEQVAQNMRIQDIEQRFWQYNFESSIQFSQSHVSENWYKGGSSNLNLFMRTYGAITYTKDKIKWKNELEDKLSIYNMDKSERSSGRGFRIADDQIRWGSNFGLKASKHWYYTVDAEARTQLLTSYRGDSDDVQSSPLAPLILNIGLGMKYDISKKFASVYQRKIVLSVNVAPLSYTYRASIRDDIDLARHGLTPSKLYFHNIGSTFRLNFQWDINMNVTWTSKLYFNTSYSNVEADWENTLNMKIGRFFSTRINLQLRFDDAVRPSSKWNKYLQYNELLSFGFNYKF